MGARIAAVTSDLNRGLTRIGETRLAVLERDEAHEAPLADALDRLIEVLMVDRPSGDALAPAERVTAVERSLAVRGADRG